MNEDFIRNAVQRIPELNPDCIVCSGDITCIGSPAEFHKACKLLEPLTSSADYDFLYVPGNHDAYISDRNWRHALTDAFGKLNKQRWTLEQMPVQHEMGGVRMFLANQCHPTPIWGSYGTLGDDVGESLQKWAAEDTADHVTHCLIGHFPTRREHGARLARRRRLRRGELIRRMLESGQLDLSLCGHIHDPYVNRFDSGALEVCAGSLTTHGCMDIIDIDGAGRISQSWLTLTTNPAFSQKTVKDPK